MKRLIYKTDELQNFFDAQLHLLEADESSFSSDAVLSLASESWDEDEDPNQEQNIELYTVSRMLFGASNSDLINEQIDFDEPIYELADYGPAYHYFLSTLKIPNYEWIDVSLFNLASETGNLFPLINKALDESVAKITNQIAPSKDTFEDNPVYYGSFKYDEFQMEALKAIRANNDSSDRAVTVSLTKRNNPFINEPNFDATICIQNPFLIRRVAQHWLDARKLRQKLDTAFNPIER
ncbi:MAG: hypothetical protein VW124_22480 [Paracoccaceae bacterium]